MDLRSGVFTAPRPGIYHFSLTGMSHHSSYGHLEVGLLLNGVAVGNAWASSSGADDRTFSLQSVLHLKTGDRIWLSIQSASNADLYDSGGHYTHFTGWLSQEDTFQLRVLIVHNAYKRQLPLLSLVNRLSINPEHSNICGNKR